MTCMSQRMIGIIHKLTWYTLADSFLRDVIVTRTSTSNLIDNAASNSGDVELPVMEDSLAEDANISEGQEIVGKNLHTQETETTLSVSGLQTPATLHKRRRGNKLSKVEQAISKLQKLTQESPVHFIYR